MLTKERALRFFAACAALAWCLLFIRCDSSAKSMVRAVLLQKDARGWTAGLLYQSPEAAADASEAAAKVAFVSAEGQSVQQALAAAERELPQTANYRLCDHVLLAAGSGEEALDDYEQAVLARQCGRLAARVERCGFTCAQYAAACEEASEAPEALLQSAKRAAAAAPRLYERGRGMLLSVLSLDGGNVSCRREGVLLCAGQELDLTANQTQAALLLAGKGGGYSFDFDGEMLTIERAVCSVSETGQGSALLRISCLLPPGAQVPTESAQKELKQLLVNTAAFFWENGCDWLGLGAAYALRTGQQNALSPTKNACPQLQADVEFYTLF